MIGKEAVRDGSLLLSELPWPESEKDSGTPATAAEPSAWLESEDEAGVVLGEGTRKWR